MNRHLCMCVCGSVRSHDLLCMRVALAFAQLRSMSQCERGDSVNGMNVQIRIPVVVL